MRTIFPALRFAAAVLLIPAFTAQQSFAWGAEGHRYISRVAAESLPADVPAFLRAPGAVNAIEYLGPEPDRWRSSAEPELKDVGAPEHFIDLEIADLIGPLPRKRYDFLRALAATQIKQPRMAADLTPEKVGTQPYAATEVYERLKAAMREYRQLAANKQDTRPVELAIIFYTGWMSHYVADGSMPLHTTVQYNGWTGANPNGYTTEHRIHGQFEGQFVAANIKPADFAPLVGRPHVLGDVFEEYVAYLRHSHTLVERTYQLEKAGGFNGAGSAESVQFTRERLAAGAAMLRDMIYTAWVKSGDPMPTWQDEKPAPKPTSKIAIPMIAIPMNTPAQTQAQTQLHTNAYTHGYTQEGEQA